MMSQVSIAPEVLLDQARGGNREALGQLLDLYRNYLKLVLRTQAGPSPRAQLDQSDLIQDTFLRAHRGFDKFRGHSEQELVAWLSRILSRTLANQVKRNRGPVHDTRREQSLEMLLDRSDQAIQIALAAPGSSPSAAAMRRERAVLLADALEKLTPDQKEVFVLRHLDQISLEEIANRMGKSTGAVKMLWLRAVEKLNAILGERP